MVKSLSENAKKIIDALQKFDGEDLTVHDLAEVLNLSVPSVTGTFNSFVVKGLGERELAEIELEDGKRETVKFLKLTDKGMQLDLNE